MQKISNFLPLKAASLFPPFWPLQIVPSLVSASSAVMVAELVLNSRTKHSLNDGVGALVEDGPVYITNHGILLYHAHLYSWLAETICHCGLTVKNGGSGRNGHFVNGTALHPASIRVGQWVQPVHFFFVKNFKASKFKPFHSVNQLTNRKARIHWLFIVQNGMVTVLLNQTTVCQLLSLLAVAAAVVGGIAIAIYAAWNSICYMLLLLLYSEISMKYFFIFFNRPS